MTTFISSSDSPLSMQLIEQLCQEIHHLQPAGLVSVLACISKLQRQIVRDKYEEMYKERISDLFQRWWPNKDDDDHNMAEVLSMWMADPNERDAVIARRALFGYKSSCASSLHVPNFKAVVEIFVGRKSSHVAMIKRAYHARFKSQLEHDVVSLELSSPHQKVLVALDASHKAHHVELSQHIAKCDAKRLYEATEVAQEALLLEMLSKRSIPQVKLTISRYNQIYGHDYLEKKLTEKGNAKELEALRSAIECMCNAPSYYSQALHAMLKWSNKSKSAEELKRVMLSRAEVDLDEISRDYKVRYGKELREIVCEMIPSGDCKEFLLAVLVGTDNS